MSCDFTFREDTGTMMQRRRTRAIPFALLLLAALALLIVFLKWGNDSLQTEVFSFRAEKLPEGFEGCRLAVLADLHGKEFGRGNDRLLQAVRNAKPDYILLAGDIADEHTDLSILEPLASGLTAIAPTYYVSGNHEWSAKILPDVAARLKNGGVVYLNNTFTVLKRNGSSLVLAGVDDPNGYADQKTPQELADEVRRDMGDPFWILMAHRSNGYPVYGTLGADLVISGHAHGGIIRLPFTDGLFGNDMNFFPTWTSGFYYDYATPLFASRGLGNVKPSFRVFNRPQLAILELTRK